MCSITRYETYDITNIVCKKFDNKYSVIIDNVLKLLFKNNKNIDSLLESTINNYYVTKKLLENGANPNIIYFGILLKNINNKKTFNLLLEYGADPTLYPEYNYNRIDINSEILENILSLIKHNFCPSNHFIEKILRYMSNNDQLSKNKEILSEIFKLIDLNQTGYETPLMKYTKYKRYDIIEFLLKHGADPNVKSECYQKYPLNVENIGIDIIRLLLEYGAGQNIENTLEILLVKYIKNIDIVKLLLEHGADPNVIIFGISALIKCKDIETIKLLFEHGADLNIQTGNGTTALMIISNDHMYKSIEIIKYLLENGAEPNIQRNDGTTALMLCKYKESVELLLQYGADPYIINSDGLNSFKILKSNGIILDENNNIEYNKSFMDNPTNDSTTPPPYIDEPPPPYS